MSVNKNENTENIQNWDHGHFVFVQFDCRNSTDAFDLMANISVNKLFLDVYERLNEGLSKLEQSCETMYWALDGGVFYFNEESYSGDFFDNLIEGVLAGLKNLSGLIRENSFPPEMRVVIHSVPQVTFKRSEEKILNNFMASQELSEFLKRESDISENGTIVITRPIFQSLYNYRDHFLAMDRKFESHKLYQFKFRVRDRRFYDSREVGAEVSKKFENFQRSLDIEEVDEDILRGLKRLQNKNIDDIEIEELYEDITFLEKILDNLPVDYKQKAKKILGLYLEKFKKLKGK